MQDTTTATNYHEKIIIQKIRGLSPDKIAEVINFIDFLSERYKENQIIKASNKLSEKTFQEAWENSEDDDYDNL